MRSPELTDTGLDLDVAGTADDVVALVQRAVASSGDDAQTTRHYVAIDGGTSADIRLRVVSVDDPAPLLAFAITTARSARGTAASTFIMQHGVQKRRRQRSLLGEEPFLSFLRSLAALVTESDDGASTVLRVHGARTVLSPPQTSPPTSPPTEAPASPAPLDAFVPAPGLDAESPVPTVQGAPQPTDVTVSDPTTTDVEQLAPGHETGSPAQQVPAALPAPEVSPPEVSPPPVSPPPFRPAAPTVVAPEPPRAGPTSSVAPELQITVPPGLIGSAPAEPARVAEDASGHARRQAGPSSAAEFDATVAAASLLAGDVALELPDGERVALRRAMLIGRNPGARPEHPDAELRAVVDPRMSVSKTHTAVVPGRRAIRVTDLHSTNGTTITDATGSVTACRPGEAYVVEPGSIIGIGEFPIRVVTV